MDEWAPGSSRRLEITDTVDHRFLPVGMGSGLRDGAASRREAERTLVNLMNLIFIAVFPKTRLLKCSKSDA